MARPRSRLIIAACLLSAVVVSLWLQRNRVHISSPPPTAAQAMHTTWQEHYGKDAPTKWGMHLLLDDGEIQWSTAVWDDHLAYARRLVGEGGYVLELVRLGDLDAEKWQIYI